MLPSDEEKRKQVEMYFCHLSSDLTDGESNGTSAAYVVKLRLNQARQDTNSKGES